ncbi:NusG domain II-containing protein [Sinanaerobacter chloroacetimidivorans]|jgi:hypothetical protein|uniref:NusG domain II-containing protein n=1 Tax=Sinanaerobacter chloroacetimidivorans TaxID=2818044 RepID=A0A8J7W3K4_9FIRM|nr:NusG domain II-containing protein [Sinanaerobacter chloroacetimidivorans]MBR0598738.1 NusG domain II-containing protein [Sinanaerobacter chloroacetimidivorans]
MKFFKKTDLIIISVILAVSAAAWFAYQHSFGQERAEAEIYYYSELVETVALDQGIEKTFSIPQDEHVVFHLYADGTIRFEESDCPDKVCIHAGRLGTVGQYAACLPNGIILKIVPVNGHHEEDVDITVGN